MRIGIDVRFMLPARVGGTEVYVRNLVAGFPQVGGDHDFVLFTNRENERSFNFDRLPRFTAEADWRRRAGMVDVLFFPGTTMIPLRSPLKRVVTVHDLQHTAFPQYFSPRERFRRWRRDRPSILRADAVITVSAFTRSALLERYPLPDDRVQVIHSGVGEAFFKPLSDSEIDAVRKKYRLPEHFIFYPARFWPHKNHRRLFEAMRQLQKQNGLSHRLVLSGEAASGPLPDGVQSLGYVAAADLPALYRAAAVTVFPSLYEGFGLPLLEAMAAGCPVVCSKAGALPETAGDAVHYVDAESPTEIAGGLEKVLADAALRSDLARRGLARARAFSWEQTARRTLAVLEQVHDA